MAKISTKQTEVARKSRQAHMIKDVDYNSKLNETDNKIDEYGASLGDKIDSLRVKFEKVKGIIRNFDESYGDRYDESVYQEWLANAEELNNLLWDIANNETYGMVNDARKLLNAVEAYNFYQSSVSKSKPVHKSRQVPTTRKSKVRKMTDDQAEMLYNDLEYHVSAVSGLARSYNIEMDSEVNEVDQLGDSLIAGVSARTQFGDEFTISITAYADRRGFTYEIYDEQQGTVLATVDDAVDAFSIMEGGIEEGYLASASARKSRAKKSIHGVPKPKTETSQKERILRKQALARARKSKTKKAEFDVEMASEDMEPKGEPVMEDHDIETELSDELPDIEDLIDQFRGNDETEDNEDITALGVEDAVEVNDDTAGEKGTNSPFPGKEMPTIE